MDSIDADASHGTAAEEGHPLEAERSCACGRSQRVSGLAASARVFVCEACAKRERDVELLRVWFAKATELFFESFKRHGADKRSVGLSVLRSSSRRTLSEPGPPTTARVIVATIAICEHLDVSPDAENWRHVLEDAGRMQHDVLAGWFVDRLAESGVAGDVDPEGFLKVRHDSLLFASAIGLRLVVHRALQGVPGDAVAGRLREILGRPADAPA